MHGRTLIGDCDSPNGRTLHFVVRLLSMQVTVKMLKGEPFALDVEPGDTGLAVKEKIEAARQIPADDQRLIYAGKGIENGKTMAHYKVQDGCSLHLVLRLRGGASAPSQSPSNRVKDQEK